MTKKQLQVMGLCEVVKRQVRAIKETEATLAELLAVPDDGDGYYGHVSDCIYEDDPFKHLSRLLTTTEGKEG